MQPLVTAEQMRALDAETIERVGVPGAALMESAGRAVVSQLWQLDRQRQLDLLTARIVIITGPGNNGGDGLVIGRYLHDQGLTVTVCLCAERGRLRGDALLQLQAAERIGTPLASYPDAAAAELLTAELARLKSGDVIIDALLGTGLNKPVSGALATVIAAINHSPALRVAVDLPSGLDADCGVPAGSSDDPVIVRAHHTICLGLLKVGLVSSPGFLFGGQVHRVDIGIPTALIPAQRISSFLLDEHCLKRLAEPPAALGHKGSHGHLLIVAGSRGKSGAALLATRAALRTGVGLCTLAAPLEVIDSVLGGQVVEAMAIPYTLPASDGDQPVVATQLLIGQLVAAGQGKSAWAIGPGLPSGPSLRQALLALLHQPGPPLVLDAEALNLLADDLAVLRSASDSGRQLVLTPHPGEALRLLRPSTPSGQLTTAAIQADRLGSARRLSQLTGAVVVLKGARSIIASDDGQRLAICPTGNGAMGSGGMGDVLTGMLGALLAAGWPAFAAACAAVYWHGLAGDLAQQQRPPGSLLLASELIAAIDPARQQALGAATARPHRDGWPLGPRRRASEE